MPSFAQVQQEVPLFKSTRTFVHKAVRKDTAWTPGAIVDQIYFADTINRDEYRWRIY